MPRAFSWLPFVDNCCTCVIDMRTATYCVTIYAIFHGISNMLRVVIPQCSNLRSIDGLGTFVHIFDYITGASALVLIIFSILMGFTTMLNKPIVKPFIITAYVETALEIILPFIYIAKLRTVDFVCQRRDFGKQKEYYIHPFLISLQIILEIGVGAIMVYFTIVVNSFAELWDQYDGRIPEPELPPIPVIVVPQQPPDSGQTGNYGGKPGAFQAQIVFPPAGQKPYQDSRQSGPPHQGSPQQGSPQQGSPQQGSPRQGSPQQGSPQQESPQQGSPKQKSLEQGLPQQSPQQGSPQQGSPQQGSPQQSPQQGSPRQVSTHLELSRLVSLQEGLPREELPNETAVRKVKPENYKSPQQRSLQQDSLQLVVPELKFLKLGLQKQMLLEYRLSLQRSRQESKYPKYLDSIYKENPNKQSQEQPYKSRPDLLIFPPQQVLPQQEPPLPASPHEESAQQDLPQLSLHLYELSEQHSLRKELSGNETPQQRIPQKSSMKLEIPALKFLKEGSHPELLRRCGLTQQNAALHESFQEESLQKKLSQKELSLQGSLQKVSSQQKLPSQKLLDDSPSKSNLHLQINSWQQRPFQQGLLQIQPSQSEELLLQRLRLQRTPQQELLQKRFSLQEPQVLKLKQELKPLLCGFSLKGSSQQEIQKDSFQQGSILQKSLQEDLQVRISLMHGLPLQKLSQKGPMQQKSSQNIPLQQEIVKQSSQEDLLQQKSVQNVSSKSLLRDETLQKLQIGLQTMLQQESSVQGPLQLELMSEELPKKQSNLLEEALAPPK